jgi:hypothetical protein
MRGQWGPHVGSKSKALRRSAVRTTAQMCGNMKRVPVCAPVPKPDGQLSESAVAPQQEEGGRGGGGNKDHGDKDKDKIEI